MSAAIMSRFDFGDSNIGNIMKKAPSNRDSSPGGHHHLDLSSATAHGVRFTLTRMASTPASNGGGSSTSQQHAQNLQLLLGNLAVAQQQQQQQQHHQVVTTHRRLERTQSAPAPPVTAIAAPSAAISATTVNTSRYKTELCRPYEEFGTCKYGDKCQFAHGGAELRSLARHPKYKTELCRTYHTVGFCPYGPRCHFVHNQEEVIQATSNNNNSKQQQPSAIMMSSPQNSPRSASVHQRARPVALSPTLSLDSPSPTCSLSQSPTSSMGSFFSSDPELHSPNAQDDQRLPVFNRLSTVQILSMGNIAL